jgi:multidrug efflux pump subunit AcrB
MEFPRNFTASDTEAEVINIENIIKELGPGEYKGMSIRIGTNDDSIFTQRGVQNSLVSAFIYLTPFSKRERDVYTIMDELRMNIEGAGLPIKSIAFNVEKIGLDMGWPFEVRVISGDDELRENTVQKISEELLHTEGLTEVDDTIVEGVDELNVVMNYERMSRAGVTVKDIITTLRIAFDGVVVTSMKDEKGETDFRLRLSGKARKDEDFIRNLPVANSMGKILNMEEFISLQKHTSRGEITHYNGSRSVTVYGSFDKTKTSASKIYGAIDKKFGSLEGVDIEFAGEPVETAKVFKDLGTAALVCLLLIFLVLALIFDSFTMPLIILLSLPFCIPGVILSLFIHGYPLSVFAGIGMIGLMGIVINNSIVLLDRILSHKRERPDEEVIEHITAAVKERIRPIILSTFTTVLGLVPTAYGLGGYDPFITQMCIGLFYGLLYGMLVSLIIVPSLYYAGTVIQKRVTGS